MSVSNSAPSAGENKGSSSCCAPSRFSCVTGLGHKPVTFFNNCQQQQNGGNDGGKSKCLWFSKDYGRPIFAMHVNPYVNSECFLIDTELSVIHILPTYQLILFKEHIHVMKDKQTKYSFKFKDGSDSFAMWIQLCAYQNEEPFTTNLVMLTNPAKTVAVENRLLRSSTSTPPTPASSWLTMKFKTNNSSSNWFTFAKMQLLSITFRKWQFVLLLLKSDDPNHDAPTGLFCIRPGVTCLKTTSQLYYEPCDSSGRKYILDFDTEALCQHIWDFVKMVTPRNFNLGNNDHLTLNSLAKTKKAQRTQSHLKTQRRRRLKMIYSCFGQLHQEVKEIMKSSKSNLQEMIDLPEIHITKLFFSAPVWMTRCRNIGDRFPTLKFMSADNLRKDITASFSLQCTNVGLHVDIVKMLMKEGVPAELIAEYRETLGKRFETGFYAGRCRRIHSIFN